MLSYQLLILFLIIFCIFKGIGYKYLPALSLSLLTTLFIVFILFILPIDYFKHDIKPVIGSNINSNIVNNTNINDNKRLISNETNIKIDEPRLNDNFKNNLKDVLLKDKK